MSLKYLNGIIQRAVEQRPTLLFEQRREYVGEIWDGCGYAHPLLILQDEGSKEYRPEARCSDPSPAWTVFITNNLRSLGRFHRRKDGHTVGLRNIESFVFIEQCPGNHGRERFNTFKLRFRSSDAMSLCPITICVCHFRPYADIPTDAAEFVLRLHELSEAVLSGARFSYRNRDYRTVWSSDDSI